MSFLHLQTFILLYQGEGDVLEAEVHVPSHEGGEEEERHPVLLGKSTRWLQETSLPLLARQTQGPVPGGRLRAPADDGEVEDHHQQEQDCRAWSSYSTPCRQGWRCRRFDS